MLEIHSYLTLAPLRSEASQRSQTFLFLWTFKKWLDQTFTFIIIWTKCYVFYRIILQKQLHLYEGISTLLGTEATWMRMGISGLLQDQMISYYLLGNFLFHICMSTYQAFWGESIAHPYEFLSCFPSYRIGPFEVESALIEHPSIAESAVVSSPDPIRGEVKNKQTKNKKRNPKPDHLDLQLYWSSKCILQSFVCYMHIRGCDFPVSAQVDLEIPSSVTSLPYLFETRSPPETGTHCLG